MTYGIFDNLMEVGGTIINAQWIEWFHWGVPNELGDERERSQIRLAIWRHCRNCTALDGCYFSIFNLPKFPAHQNCDCEILLLSKDKLLKNIDATCKIEKFSDYIFGTLGKENGKFDLFTSWGYTKDDAIRLAGEFSRQGAEKYVRGDYKLRQNGEHGQLIAIMIELGGKVFYSGWMVEPEGKIRLVTPFAGRI